MSAQTSSGWGTGSGRLIKDRSRAEIAAECRAAAEMYDEEAARAEAKGNHDGAAAFRHLAQQRRERARLLEMH